MDSHLDDIHSGWSFQKEYCLEQKYNLNIASLCERGFSLSTHHQESKVLEVLQQSSQPF